MKTESLQELVNLCRARLCKITLKATSTGVVMTVTAYRDMSIGGSTGLVSREVSRWLDANDAEIGLKLDETTQMVQ